MRVWFRIHKIRIFIIIKTLNSEETETGLLLDRQTAVTTLSALSLIAVIFSKRLFFSLLHF